jgi:hypothetical protein|nr:MAG TPA: hypothetical protein [Caudoviricetes sp.]
MQKVSKEYKTSMKDSLRERAYIMLSFGLVNQEAQSKAKIDSGDFTYYSNKNNLFGQRDDSTIYATLEENFTKVDGSMFFLPRKNDGDGYYDTGLIGANLVSAAQYVLTINLHTAAIDFRGLTINFGENYPVDFDIVSSQGQVIEFRDNDTGDWSTEEVLENTTYVRFIFYTMKNPQSRLRIYSIRFGYGLVYYNDSVMSSQLDSYVSPIGADVPQIDFSVTLKNYDKYFNVDNPKSAINFLETGQEMDIYYGYHLPESDEIEWIRGNHLLCSEWESDDFTATIRCQDVFRSMDSEYFKGTYTAAGISYYDLAEAVLRDAGQTSYYIDPRLKHLYTKNPLPRVKHKEALQIIANACRCVLSQTRLGQIQIKSNFAPDAAASANAQESYSNVANILNGEDKDEYATLATNYTVADGTMFFLPRNGVSSLNTGFVSQAVSGADCKFSTNPVVTIVQEAQCLYHGVKFTFGNALPAAFTIRTYNNGELVEEYENEDEITKVMVILHDFDDFDTMEIEFTETAEPYNRIVLNSFAFGDITDFTMTRNDMTSSPKAIKQELIKEVIVPCYSYQNGTQEESLVSEDVTVKSGDVETFYVGEPSYNFRVLLNEATSGVTITASGSYYVTVRFSVTGTYRFEILGYRYKIVERYSTITLHARGKSVKWENPLMSDTTMAQDLAEWLAEYYSSGIEYEYDTRGFPEIDSNDIVYQENEFHEGMKVNIYRQTLTFNQAFGGKVVARRQGG